jgi:hypothetical protein
LGQQTQQCALALEHAAQNPRDRKGPVTAWNWGEDLGRKFFCKQNGAFGLTAGAEISGAARKGQKMLLPTFPGSTACLVFMPGSAGRPFLRRRKRAPKMNASRF